MTKDYYGVIRYPLTTEKSVRIREQENKLIFVVDKYASKQDIKHSIEKMFNVKVLDVNVTILNDGRKKAYVKLAKENIARDVITQMGLM